MGILDFLWKERKKKSSPQLSKEVPSWKTTTHKFSLKARPRDELQALVNGRGHKDFFCLDDLYSPGSRMPAIDFSPWIIEKINKRDREALRVLLWELVSGNPGVAISTGGKEEESNFFKREWLSEIDKILDADLSNYIVASDEVLNEIRAFMLFACIHNGLTGFIMTTEFPSMLSLILIPWKIEFKNFEILVDRANSFIRKMRKDVFYWKEFPLYRSDKFPKPKAEDFNPLLNQELGGLPLSTRLHFFDICAYTQFGVKPVGKTIDYMTFYSTRQMGIDEKESAQILLKSGLVHEIRDPSLLLSMRTKDQLGSMLTNAGIPFKKTWKKAVFIDAVMKGCGESIRDLADKTYFGNLNPEFSEPARKSWELSRNMVDYYKVLLGFIAPDKRFV